MTNRSSLTNHLLQQPKQPVMAAPDSHSNRSSRDVVPPLPLPVHWISTAPQQERTVLPLPCSFPCCGLPSSSKSRATTCRVKPVAGSRAHKCCWWWDGVDEYLTVQLPPS